VPDRLLTRSVPPKVTLARPVTLSQVPAVWLSSTEAKLPGCSVRLLLMVSVPMDVPGARVPPAVTMTGPVILPAPVSVPPATVNVFVPVTPLTSSVPLLSVIEPLCVLVAGNATVPRPLSVRLPVPLMTPLTVRRRPPATLQVCAAPRTRGELTAASDTADNMSMPPEPSVSALLLTETGQIGRASCRERVE